MVPSELEFVGVLPEVEGRVLEGLRIEGMIQNGVQEGRCHIAYWRMEGQWWRSFAEGYALHIRQWGEEPVSWDGGPKYLYPVTEVAQECYGLPLRQLEIFIFNDCPALRLMLEDGRAIECLSNEQGFSWNRAVLRSPDGSTTSL
ncbi:hypothetical protein DAERI_050213 [Deinococcus aerius]|uniref:Uncharacterized protein n=1 Tax=Deinococcus aerius TaxID=200253 RepID=A0A2I9CUY4_9DEIO|nr:hypothetical protein [Deinococcus aerius]GBF05704.1 hypothetical protein DAERI_050213 [Deinococcus aerius]